MGAIKPGLIHLDISRITSEMHQTSRINGHLKPEIDGRTTPCCSQCTFQFQGVRVSIIWVVTWCCKHQWCGCYS